MQAVFENNFIKNTCTCVVYMSVHVRGCTGHVERERELQDFTLCCVLCTYSSCRTILYVDLYQLSLKIVASLNVQSRAQVHAAVAKLLNRSVIICNKSADMIWHLKSYCMLESRLNIYLNPGFI